jgi:uncharacterized protein (TIGR04222 family)
MNPFGLGGPEFLVFYAGVTTLMIVVSRVLLRGRERVEGSGGGAVRDPYLMAVLRGGRMELLRVAVVALADRELLAVREGQAEATDAGLKTAPANEVERELLEYCREPRTAAALFGGPVLRDAADRYEDELLRLGFILGRRQHVARRNVFLAGTALLLAITAVRVAAAFTTGHTHVDTLIFLTGAAIGFFGLVLVARRTAAGDAYVREVRNRFKALSLRPRDLRGGHARAELAMIAAVFGTATLSLNEFAWAHRFFASGYDPTAGYVAGAGACDGGAACGAG